MNLLDHILWGAPSLGVGIEEFARLTDVRLAPGGRHPGFGTHNALATFGDKTYIEIIAPDPSQDITGTPGAFLARLAHPSLFHFAVNTTAIEAMQDRLSGLGLGFRLVSMSRTRADGVTLNWRNLYPEGHDYGFALPFFIQWDTDFHPSGMPPAGLSLTSFALHHPRDTELRQLYETLDIPVPVVAADTAFFKAEIETPKGTVELTGPVQHP